MKTPDTGRAVTKKDGGDGIEWAGWSSLSEPEAQQGSSRRGRGDRAGQDALGECALSRVGWAHRTKETTRFGALKGRFTRGRINERRRTVVSRLPVYNPTSCHEEHIDSGSFLP